LTAEIIAEAVGGGLERREGLDVGFLLRSIHAPRRERNLHAVPGFLRRGLNGRAPAENDQVGERDLRPAGLRAVEFFLDCFQRLEHLCEVSWLVDIPVLLRREPDACAVSAAALVGTAERRRRCPGRRDEL